MVAVVVLTAFAVAIELHYGRRGFMALDHSVVFDGGWRTLSGQVPFRDYTTPNALTPSLLQAVFFAGLGVTWFAYLVHAAVFNALFAVLVYVLLRRFGLGRGLSTLYGLLSAVVFYPPIGVPFHDQHAFFFVLLGVVLAVAATQADDPRRAGVLWAAAPFALLAAFLSKQTPALLGAPIVLALALALAQRSSREHSLRWLAAGGALSLGLVALVAAVARVDPGLVRTYFLELPAATGRGRTQSLPLETVADSFVTLIPELESPFLIWLAAPLVAVAAAKRGRLRGDPQIARALGLALAFLLVCQLFTRITLNQHQQGVPFVFVSVGLLHVALERTFGGLRLAGRLPWLLPLGVVLVAFALADGRRFNEEVNESRIVNDMTYEAPTPEQQARLPAALSYMRWDVPDDFVPQDPGDLRSLVTYLERRPGNFLVFGDASILYALTGRESTFPALYMWAGLAFPPHGSVEFYTFEGRVLDALARYDVRRLVLEPSSVNNVRLPAFPTLAGRVDSCGADSRRVAVFTVVELPPGCVRASPDGG